MVLEKSAKFNNADVFLLGPVAIHVSKIFAVKFIHSEKATKFCKIFTLFLTGTLHRTELR